MDSSGHRNRLPLQRENRQQFVVDAARGPSFWFQQRPASSVNRVLLVWFAIACVDRRAVSAISIVVCHVRGGRVVFFLEAGLRGQREINRTFHATIVSIVRWGRQGTTERARHEVAHRYRAELQAHRVAILQMGAFAAEPQIPYTLHAARIAEASAYDANRALFQSRLCYSSAAVPRFDANSVKLTRNCSLIWGEVARLFAASLWSKVHA